MTGWNRSPRIPARLSRWINFVDAALQQWAQPTRRLNDACLVLPCVRRRRSVRLGLEALEARVLLDANSALVGDLAQLRNDMATSAVALVNAVQPSPTNTPTPASVASQWNKAWTMLTADWQQTRQDFMQFQDAALGAVHQVFDTLLNDLGLHLPGQSTSSALSRGSGSGSGSPSSGGCPAFRNVGRLKG